MWSNTPPARVGDIVGNDWVAHLSGVHMSRLGDEDKRAVDLLLDQPGPGEFASGNAVMFVAPRQDGFERRVRAVQSLLQLLDSMRVEDPPADLTERTLLRIELRGYDRGTSQVSTSQQAQPKHNT